MISKIRNNLSGNGFRYILWLGLLSLAGGSVFVAIFERWGKPSGAVATIDGLAITPVELRRKVYEVEERMKSGIYKLLFPNAADNAYDQAMEELITEKMLLSASYKLGLKDLSHEHINDAVKRVENGMLPAYLYDARGDLDFDKFDQFLHHQGISERDLYQHLENSLRQQFVLELAKNAFYEPLSSLERLHVSEKSLREFVILKLPLAYYIGELQKKSPVTLDALRTFFDKKNMYDRIYSIPERRTATVWTFTPANYALKATDKDIQVYFDQHKKEFEGKKLESVRSVLEKAVKEQKFAARFASDAHRLIAQSKEGQANALQEFVQKHKGVQSIVTTTDDAKNASLLQKMSTIKSVGKLAMVNDNNLGYLILLDSIEPAHTQKFEAIQDRVEKDYYKDLAVNELHAAMQAIRLELTADNYQEVAKKWHAKTQKITIKGSSDAQWQTATQEGLPVARMKNMTAVGSETDLFDEKKEQAYFVVLLNVKQEGPAESAASQRLLARDQHLFSQALIASLQKRAKIKNYRSEQE